ncbi:hypothetical protein Pla108_21350 [Botrimarina colliarenosi]|uniref:DUF2157 domain-containing protein n=1 Tax=Botrimarina colliarenosi TaxID=2528001 RepID=A0A5C6AEX0_9BACT|nr:hypothetical protein [Botrimarina colliarenosi]TWT97980.1 hypothetical protein Pla108_21350 [Botrimarina colliarenosi]
MSATDLPPTDTPPTDQDSLQGPGPNRLVAMLVDPRGLQALMLAGGGLLSLGLVLWLFVIGVFDEPLPAAVGLGVANFALLGLGVAVCLRTRYRLAGRATAMLACLLLPLNLWFYDAQGLVTLAGGGNLWIPALIGCVVYAGVARWLRDSLFVYAFAAGVAMTGLVFLADGDVGHFWEVLAPSTLLVTLGVAAIHAERLFPTAQADAPDDPFTRQNFGLAFFRAGHTLLASGLVVLLAGRFAGRFYETLFAHLEWFTQPDVSLVGQVKLAACGLTLAGAYAYAYSHRFVARGHRFVVMAALCLAWCALIGVDLAGIELTETLAASLLGAVAIACRVAGRWLTTQNEDEESGADSRATDRVAGVAATAALTLVLVQLFRALLVGSAGPLGFDFGLGYIAAAGLATAATWLGARRSVSQSRFVAPALASVALAIGVAACLPQFSAGAWLVPAGAFAAAGWGAAARLRSGRDEAIALAGGAETSAWLVGALVTPMVVDAPNLATMATSGLLTAAFAMAAVGPRRERLAVAAVLAAVATGWQAVVVYQIGACTPLVVLSGVSLVLIALERIGKGPAVGVAARIGLVLSATAGVLLAGNRLLAGEVAWPLLGMVAAQAVMSGLAVTLSRPQQGRRALAALGVGQVAVAGLLLNTLSVLTFGQRIEVFAAAVGVGLVVAGLIGWRREAEEGEAADSLTDFNLWAGSLLATAPLTIGLVATRLFGGDPGWIALHEVGVLAIGLVLVGVGALCRLRATTLAGVGSLAVYLFSLATLLQMPDQLQNVAVYLMAGGGAVFAVAILLSVYRDRLLALPDRIREGEGVFAVLKWR